MKENKITKGREIRICKECGINFECRRSGKQKYCSYNCAHKKVILISIKCDYCGKDIEKEKRKYDKVINHFCNRNCSNKFRKGKSRNNNINVS